MTVAAQTRTGPMQSHPLSRPDYRRLTPDWAEQSIPERFRRQARATPNRLALKTRHGSLTYDALDRLSNRIADAILARRSSGREAVCLLLEHDADVPAAILGVLKTGKFFVALDVGHPPERNALLIEDTEATLLVTNARHLSAAQALVGEADRVINIDALGPDDPDHDPEVEVTPDDLAYLVYTSGSTGKPKGVIHTHRNALFSTLQQTNGWEICPEDRVGLFFTYNFGACQPNMLGALLTGASLHPFDVKRESPARLIEWLNEDGITFFHIVPTLFRHLVSTMGAEAAFQALRLIRLAGETIYGNDIRLYQEHFGEGCILQVGMGSSEAGVVFQSYFDQSSACPEGAVAPGFPVEGIKVLLLDDDGQPVAQGEVGEIAVRSRYVFLGYWRRPELTEQVLLPDPKGGPERTLRLRDLGQRLPDGRIRHMGRKDAQVKIRGHRVEVGEVELALGAVPGISAAAVIARESEAGGKQLVAYVVRDDSASMPTSLLRSMLKDKLPSYMLPAAFVGLDSLPRTTSGKVDRAELSARPLPASERAFVAPRDHLEVTVHAIWQEVLGTEGFGIHDDFFDLGGDSLMALKMSMAVEEATGQRVNLANFPSELTVELVADAVEADERLTWERPILEVQAGGSAPPIYFCHGAIGSGGFFCRALSSHIGPEQPFFAIPPHGLDGGDFPQRIEEMAADRVAALRAHRPDGPYRLGGFCWGGYVALEMARQLRAQGAEVDALLLIDSDPRDIRVMRPIRRAIHHLGALLSLSEATELALFRKCRRVVNVWNGPAGARRIFAYPFKWATRRIFGDRRDPDARDVLPGQGDIPATLARKARFPIYHRIVQNYLPERYAGKVVVFQSRDVRERYAGDTSASWRRIAPDVETHSIAGGHQTCVTIHVDDVASQMRAHLRWPREGVSEGATRRLPVCSQRGRKNAVH